LGSGIIFFMIEAAGREVKGGGTAKGWKLKSRAGYPGLMDFQVDCAAALGAPEGGVLAGPSLQGLLETVLAVEPPGRVFLAPALLPLWGRRIADRGGRPVPLPEGGAPPVTRAGDQVWMDLGEPLAADDAAVAALLGAAREALVVLLRDDAAGRTRTQRLAVDRPGHVLLLRESACGAYALGRPERLRALRAAAGFPDGAPIRPRAGGGGSLLVLDVDGVLIDPGRAFTEAVAGALGDLAPGLAWHGEDYLSLKRAGSFNNDFRLAAAAVALARRGEPIRGAAFDGLEADIAEWEPRCAAAVRAHYARTRHLERALVTRAQLEGCGDLAICTGRPPRELGFAFEVLGFTLPAVADSAPHLRKPRPEGLVQLADAFRAGRITFVGDSQDDAAALRAARALRPELRWRFAAVGPERGRFALPGDLQGERLTDLLESGALP
jgi:phosphoglycolate phosphatase-like HAD superfamily hydrolase